MTCGLEIRGSDTRSDIPAGFDSSAATGIQQYILQHVRRGDAVLLNRTMMRVGEDLRIQYEICHKGRNVGLLDGAAVFMTIKVFSSWKVVMPVRIRDVYVDDIDSVAGLPGAAQRSGLGFADIWLRVRVTGLGTPEYSDQELQQVKRQ
jgi:hypothetical protein